MSSPRRTQAERRAETSAALVGAARRLFAEQGYAGVATGDVAAAAAVTRGALYHHFADKRELFAAVVEAVEADVAERIVALLAESGATDPLSALRAAAGAWLEVAADEEVQRIVLLDASTVLGPEGLREIALRHGLGLTESLLHAGMDSGHLAVQPVGPLAQILLGALNEAAMMVARAPDQVAARQDARAILFRLVDGLAA